MLERSDCRAKLEEAFGFRITIDSKWMRDVEQIDLPNGLPPRRIPFNTVGIARHPTYPRSERKL